MAGRHRAAIIFALCLLAPLAADAAPQEAKQPAWAELGTDQKKTLAPVAKEWDNMPATQRKKLLVVAKRYPKMTPSQQERIQARLKEWAELTLQERELARKKYQKLQQLSPEERAKIQKKWQEYQRLTHEERESLRRKATAPAASPSPSDTPKSEVSAILPAAVSGTASDASLPKAEMAKPATN